jgi:hypothetical protein
MRPRSAGVALATPLLLLAAACGSQRAGVFHPAGELAAAGPPASAGRAASGPVPFPGKVTFSFGPLPAGRAQAALVTRDRDFILAYYDAIYTRGRDTGYRSYIGNSGVLASVQAAVAEHVDAGQGFAGVDRHFDTTVSADQYNPADEDVTYCVDEAGLRYTDIRTGRVLGNSSTPGELYYSESDTFTKGRHGTWSLVGTLVTPYPKGQARGCKP